MDAGDEMNVGRAGQSGYVGLRETAVEVLSTAPNGLEASVLARQLFGAASGDRWLALLPAVLGADDRLAYDGARWRLTRPPGGAIRIAAAAFQPPIDPAFLHDQAPVAEADVTFTLALATTGADPRRHRIARIAVVRQEHGETTARFDRVVSTGRRLSKYLSDAARVAVEDLDDAPTFADVVPELRTLLDGHAAHAYGARRTRAFLDAELRRAELPGLDFDVVELDTLIAPLLPGARKPGLFAAADELGVPHNGRGSPLAEADLAARVLARLHERLATSPPRPSLVEPADYVDPERPLPFTREWLSSVPNSPGVYVFEDEPGSALYVGKAIDLHRRLSAYVGRQPSLHRRLEGLAVRAAAATTIATPSDLEATLLEARLIRERQPAFNVSREVRAPATIIRAAPDARSPGVRLVGEVASDGARYFGPFESANAARQVLAVARAAYPEAFTRRRGDVAAQRQAVLAVCRLLSGQKQPTLALLRERMQIAAAAGDRPEVDRLRAALRDVQALSTRPSDLAGLADGWRLLVLERLFEGGPARLHLIQDSTLVASADTDTSTLPSDPERLRQFAEAVFDNADDDHYDEVARPDSWMPEDSTILMRWLSQARSRLEIQRLPTEPPLDET